MDITNWQKKNNYRLAKRCLSCKHCFYYGNDSWVICKNVEQRVEANNICDLWGEKCQKSN